MLLCLLAVGVLVVWAVDMKWSCLIFFLPLAIGRNLIAGFWHIYWNGTINEEIIHEQYQVLNSSGLLHMVDKIFVSSVGEQSTKASKNILTNYINSLSSSSGMSKFRHPFHQSQGQEVHTLSHLYRFCAKNRGSKVFYFHNKGSYRGHPKNPDFRKSLNCFVLNPSCIQMLDEYDTCGMRISPVPMVHYPGNFWWATCRYITKLIHPLSYLQNETFRELTNELSPDEACVGRGRYFAEHWIGSAPSFNASDCLPLFPTSKYMLSYDLPMADIQQICPNLRSSVDQYPTSCGPPHVSKSPFSFHKHMSYYTRNFCSSPETVIKRSYLWYGQAPVSAIQWRNSLFQSPSGVISSGRQSQQKMKMMKPQYRPTNRITSRLRYSRRI